MEEETTYRDGNDEDAPQDIPQVEEDDNPQGDIPEVAVLIVLMSDGTVDLVTDTAGIIKSKRPPRLIDVRNMAQAIFSDAQAQFTASLISSSMAKSIQAAVAGQQSQPRIIVPNAAIKGVPR